MQLLLYISSCIQISHLLWSRAIVGVVYAWIMYLNLYFKIQVKF
jgi:uncharacterized membrane protein YciS (DUF1049 family)